MNKDDLIKKLENLDFPEVELQGHKRRLKMALLNSGYWKEKTTMSLLKKIAPIGAVAVIALLVIAGVNYFKSPSSVSVNNLSLAPAAYAKELVGLAQEQLTSLKAIAAIPDPSTGFVEWKTPDGDGNIRDEKGNIIYTTNPETGELVPMPYEAPAVRETITKDFALLLEEAYQAKDLAYIGDKILPDGKKVRVLHFTKEGRTVILGIDENNLPVVKIVNDETGGGIILERGTSNGKSIEEMMNFWTENLEQPKDFNAIQK